MKGVGVIDVPGMVSGVAPTSATVSTLSGCAHLRVSTRLVTMAIAKSRARTSRQRMVAHAPQVGVEGISICQILASSRNRGEWPVPLSRGDLYVGRDGRFMGMT